MEITNNKFNEREALLILKNHILGTYDQHYSMNKIQATEFIFDAGHGESFCLGNIIKYAQRYGKKDGKKQGRHFKNITLCNYVARE